jgi:PAS domain S-box-containing protein
MHTIFIIFLFSIYFAFGQNYLIKNFSKRDGLMHLQIFDIVQDKNDFIWLATGGGICKYDGSEFKNFTIRDGLPSAEFYDLELDTAGFIWFAGTNGIGNLNPLDTKINNINILPNSKNDFGTFSVLPLTTSVLIGTRNKGLQIYSDSSFFQHPISEFSNGSTLKLLKRAPDGSIWGMFEDDFLFQLDADLNIAKKFTGDAFNRMQSFVIADEETIFFLTKKSLYQLNTLTGKVTLLERLTRLDSTLECYQMSFKDGFSLITTNKGVILREKNRSTILDQKNGLSIKLNSSSLIDRSGSIWIGSDSNGLAFLHTRKVQVYTETSGLKNATVNALIEDGDDILIATDKGVHRLNQQSEISADPRFAAISEKTIWSLAKNGSEIWVGTDEHVYLYRIGVGLKQVNNLPKSTFLNFYKGQNDIVYICSVDGLFMYDQNGISTQTYLNSLSGGIVWTVREWGKKLLLGTQRGLVVYDPETYEAKVFSDKHPNVYSIEFTADSSFYFGNDFGLYEFKNNRFIDINKTYGEDFEVISTIKIVNDTLIWVADQNGLELFNGKKIVLSYDSRTDYISAEVTTESAFLASRGKYYFGLFEGLLEIEPEINKNDYVPDVVFTKTNFRNSLGDIVFNGSANNVFVPEVSSAEFEFISPWYANSNVLEYSYRLIGKNTTWSSPSKLRSVNFSNLRFGDYTFEVKAISNLGFESGVSSYSFHIEKQFWATWWFIFFCVGFGVYLVFYLIAFYTKVVKKRSAEMERRVRMRTRELISAKEETERVVDFAAISIITVDILGKIIYMNREARSVFQHEGKSLINASISELDHEHDTHSFMSLTESKNSTSLGQYNEVIKRHLSGKRMHLLISQTPINDSYGNPTGYTFFINNITNSVEMREKEAHYEKFMAGVQVMNQLLGTMSHYVNNSVASIKSILDLHAETGKFQDEVVRYTYEHTERIGFVVKSLRNLTQNLNLKVRDYANGSTKIFDIESDLEQFDESLGKFKDENL